MSQKPWKPGKLIALYGINNLGKSTQVALLVERAMRELGLRVRPRKYPLYDLEPTGPLINEYLRKKNPRGLTPRDFQIIQTLNRLESDARLRQGLGFGDIIVAEDYWGTGVAWGVGAGVDQDFLIGLNASLAKEDLAILMDGERFLKAREKNHAHEENDELTERVRRAHIELAEMFGWHIVNTNQPIEEVHKEIWLLVKPLLED